MSTYDEGFAAVMRKLTAGGTHKIAVAVSGGSDSLALVFLLQKWVKRNGGEFVALTIDHGLRQESANEAKKTHALMTEHNIEHYTLKWKGEKPVSNIQAQAREARYKLLARWCHNNNFNYLCTGHQKEDQAETVMMRLVRGSGIDGLGAIPSQSTLYGISVIRPLLTFSRRSLESILSERNISWVEDPSNSQRRFTRSRIRQLIAHSDKLVGLEPETLTGRLADIASHMQRARDYLDGIVKEYIQTHIQEHKYGFVTLNIEQYYGLHSEIGLRVLARLLQSVGGQYEKPRFSKLSSLYTSILSGEFSSAATLHGCIIRPNSKGYIDIIREPEAVTGLIPLTFDLDTQILWDGRFNCKINWDRAEKKGIYELKCLGVEGFHRIKEQLSPALVTSMPKKVFYTLPSLWKPQAEIPSCIPHLGYTDNSITMDAEVSPILMD